MKHDLLQNVIHETTKFTSFTIQTIHVMLQYCYGFKPDIVIIEQLHNLLDTLVKIDSKRSYVAGSIPIRSSLLENNSLLNKFTLSITLQQYYYSQLAMYGGGIQRHYKEEEAKQQNQQQKDQKQEQQEQDKRLPSTSEELSSVDHVQQQSEL